MMEIVEGDIIARDVQNLEEYAIVHSTDRGGNMTVEYLTGALKGTSGVWAGEYIKLASTKPKDDAAEEL